MPYRDAPDSQATGACETRAVGLFTTVQMLKHGLQPRHELSTACVRTSLKLAPTTERENAGEEASSSSGIFHNSRPTGKRYPPSPPSIRPLPFAPPSPPIPPNPASQC